MTADTQKKVDESWKESVNKEKSSPADQPAAENDVSPGADFLGFISTLAMQVSAIMEEEQGLPQARYLIDVIQLLSDKTKGNLSPPEETELKNVLYALRVKFVKKNQGAA